MESLILFLDPFDPVHDEDLRYAQWSSLHLNADVFFVPFDSFPEQNPPQASKQARIEMLNLALKKEGSSSLQLANLSPKNKTDGSTLFGLLSYFHATYPHRQLFVLLSPEFAPRVSRLEGISNLLSLATPICLEKAHSGESKSLVHYLDFGQSQNPVTDEDIQSLRSGAMPTTVRDYIEQKGLYYIAQLKNKESSHRLDHSISVAHLAYRIAVSNHYATPWKAYVAGLIHDLAKNLPKEEARDAMQKYYPDLVGYPEWTYHQFLARVYARKWFRIQDEEVLDAIGCHATGKAHMTELAKIIYSSDKIDPKRGYDSSKLIAACMRNYHNGFVSVLFENRIYLEGRGYKIDNPLTKECMELYLGGNHQ